MPFLYFLRTIQLGYSQNKNKTGGIFTKKWYCNAIFIHVKNL